MLYYACVQANYFETLRIPIILGSGFRSAAGQPERSAVLSESAAKQLWPGENPVGRSVRLGATDDRAHPASELLAEGPAYLVIGVARDTSGAQFDGGDAKRVYLPLPEDQLQKYPILLRTQSDPAQVMRAIDLAVSSLVLVRWIDSAAPDTGWIRLREYTGVGSMQCLSVGYLIRDDDGRKTIAPHIANPDDEEQRQGTGLMVIPDQAVLSVERLICPSSEPVCVAPVHSFGHEESEPPSSGPSMAA